MKLDFKDHINEFGDNLVRLFAFDQHEALLFKQALVDTIIDKKESLKVDQLDFIEAQNCTLTLAIGDEDLGIYSEDKKHFIGALTLASFEKMVTYITPFCNKESKAYRMLYDVDSLTDFVFTPSGT
jgi:hypothetical protein